MRPVGYKAFSETLAGLYKSICEDNQVAEHLVTKMDSDDLAGYDSEDTLQKCSGVKKMLYGVV